MSSLPYGSLLRPFYIILVVILLAIAVGRLVPTYSIFTATYDEPGHIGNGMQWLQRGTRSEFDHPPLGQVAVALGPYLKGLRSHALGEPFADGFDVLYAEGNYWRNLMLARLGNVPFLLLAGVVVILWSRRWFTHASGIWALLLLLSLPPILGHAAVATIDMACAATVALSLYQFIRWLETPGLGSCIRLAAALSLAILCKFSGIGFFVVCCLVTLIYFALVKRGRVRLSSRHWTQVRHVCISGCILLVLLWAGYRFHSTTISRQVGYHPSIDARFGPGPIRNIVYKVLEQPIPMAQLAMGVRGILGRAGQDSYLLGEYRFTGWWYFFPVVLGVKTPIGFLLLAMAGLTVTLSRWRSVPWQQTLTALFPIAILLLCMTSRINLGVRHILSIYPLLALMAGHVISLSFQHRTKRILSVISVAAACSVVVDAWKAHPDYLAYFNQLAGSHPEKILCESDLDWGQDLHRLSVRLKSMGVKEVAIRYFGSAMLEHADLPHYRALEHNEKATGYFAISLRYTNMDYASEGAYGWLKHYTPLERIGKSIDLYYIDR